MIKSKRSGRRRYTLKCLVAMSVVPLAVTLAIVELNYIIALPNESHRSETSLSLSQSSMGTNNAEEEKALKGAVDDIHVPRRSADRKDKQDKAKIAVGDDKKTKRMKKEEEKDEKKRNAQPMDIKDKGVSEVESAKTVVSANDGQRGHQEKEKMKADKKKRLKREEEENEAIFESVRRAVENAISESNSTIPNCLDPNGPQPIILMSLGRSGSGSTWQVLGSMTGMETPSVEYTGSSREESLAFFDKVGPDDRGWWLMKYMCYMQRKFPKAGVVGFKWKPNRSITRPGAINGLKLLSELKNPSIKLVRSRRNLLDVIISRYKHHKKHGRKVPAHCKVGDEDCVKMQLKAGTGVELPTNKLLSLLKTLSKEEDEVDQRLEKIGVPHVDASFEKLYYGEDANEWRNIFHFVGVGPTEGLTLEKVNGVMAHASTSHPSHEKAIRNYDEVRSLLLGTEFEELLHP